MKPTTDDDQLMVVYKEVLEGAMILKVVVVAPRILDLTFKDGFTLRIKV